MLFLLFSFHFPAVYQLKLFFYLYLMSCKYLNHGTKHLSYQMQEVFISIVSSIVIPCIGVECPQLHPPLT